MKNQGKIFEQDFRASLNLDNPDLFFYRFKDRHSFLGKSTKQWN